MSAFATLSGIDIHSATEADSVAGVTPQNIARPGSTDELSAIMRAASADGLRVVPRGAGTTVGWGPAPRACDVVVDLSRMNQVLEHHSGDLIVSAQAGTPLTTVQEAVAGSGQRLALDEMVAGSTVGGVVATNLSGPRRMAYGTARDLVIGVTIVRPDGVVATAGGKVVKNVAGYDLGKLMVGSHGTLAILASAYFRLHPIPAATQWVTATRESPAESRELIAQLVASQVVPAAVELDAEPGGLTRIGVLLEGTQVGVDGRIGRTVELCGPESVPSDEPLFVGFPGNPQSALLKLTCRLSSVIEVTRLATELGFHVRGSAGTGVLYAAAPASGGASAGHRNTGQGTPPEEFATAVAVLRSATGQAGGATVVMRGAPPGVDAWGPVGGFDLMRAVKDRFDPYHLLSPGRFVGGL